MEKELLQLKGNEILRYTNTVGEKFEGSFIPPSNATGWQPRLKLESGKVVVIQDGTFSSTYLQIVHQEKLGGFNLEPQEHHHGIDIQYDPEYRNQIQAEIPKLNLDFEIGFAFFNHALFIWAEQEQQIKEVYRQIPFGMYTHTFFELKQYLNNSFKVLEKIFKRNQIIVK